MSEMRAGLRLPDETGETTSTPAPPPERHPVASCDGCDVIGRGLMEAQAEIEGLRADVHDLATRLGRLQNHLLGAGKAQ